MMSSSHDDHGQRNRQTDRRITVLGTSKVSVGLLPIDYCVSIVVTSLKPWPNGVTLNIII